MLEKSTSLNKEGLRDINIVKLKVIKEEGSPYRANQMKNAGDLASVAREFLAGEDREIFIAINLDRGHRINSVHVVAIGTLVHTMIHPREVFKAAILSNAESIAIAHNHPSGNPEPSPEDVKVTLELLACGDLLGIKLLDHIIVGDDRYASFSEPGGKPLSWQSNYFVDGQKKSRKEVKEMTKVKSDSGGGEIFAYRIGENLFCPECFEKAATNLKAVQDPEDPQVTFPAKALSADDIQVYICGQCKKIKRSLKKEGKPNITNVTKDTNDTRSPGDPKKVKPLIDLQDMVENCAAKIALLDDFFAHGHEPDTEFFSEDGKFGFHCILTDMQNDLNLVIDGMQAIASQGEHKSSELARKRTAFAAEGLLEMIGTARAMGKI